MFIVYGTKALKKEYGTLPMETECPKCHNMVRYNLFTVWRWATLFWIPIFPIGRKHYYVACPICNYGYEISKEDFEKYV